jgi:hypothetical protein
MTKAQEMYPLGRDETESRRLVLNFLYSSAFACINYSRLNEQHKLLLDIVGGAIDKDVPLGNISTVADVATGTG